MSEATPIGSNVFFHVKIGSHQTPRFLIFCWEELIIFLGYRVKFSLSILAIS